ncbi:MAG TPA: hypothetical protein VK845_06680 [Gemmatimonadales bacterium]|nr:hypothetical protein [Gemmatimonadales bacterium]
MASTRIREGWPDTAVGAALLTGASLMVVYPVSIYSIRLLVMIPGIAWENIPSWGIAALKECPVMLVSGILYFFISSHSIRALATLRGVRGHVWRCVVLYIVGGVAVAATVTLWGDEGFWYFGDLIVWLVAVAVGGIVGDGAAAWRARSRSGGDAVSGAVL